ncbi:metallophosphoesterase [Pigmentiphaga litoralis]|uniref:Calcineurin-like phosphoesterase domain-containing protein n=1 Tax=Pigmentiphaga litoralis TaxID=516702 RepID=A0A7Y9IQH5_9BURK|nr:hypothetical protein [Pigmentiphaga litoralis]NYE81066.1 hypothetical protein [Pigmentiphaga litoralis]
MFHVNLFLAFLYVAARLVLPLPWSVAGRAVLAVVLLIVSKYHLLQIWTFGTMYSPEMPRPAVLVMGWLFVAFFLMILLTALFDVGLIVSWVARKRRALPGTTRTRGRYAVMIVALLLSAIGVQQALRVPDVQRVEVAIRNLPPALDGFKLVQLTDLHLQRLMNAEWATQVVARTNALSPDLVVITGDLIDGTVDARRPDIQPLADLKARHGVITSLGNHEYYFGAPEWTAEFQRLGMRVLVNENTAIGDPGRALYIAAVTDMVATRFGLDNAPDLSRAMSGIPAGAPVVLLSHRPVDMLRNAAAGVGLQLSGHTHGGMIRGFDLIVKQANGGVVSGRYDFGGMTLYVSNGTGLWNGFPVRLGVPSEITEFVLKAKAGAP